MQGRCPNCKGLFEIKQEWIGMKAPCPHCHQTITLLAMPTSSPSGTTAPTMANGASNSVSHPVQYQRQPARQPMQYQQQPASQPMQYQQPQYAGAQQFAGAQQYAGSPQLASVFERFIAMIIDGLLVGVVTTIIGFVISFGGSFVLHALTANSESENAAIVGALLINIVTSIVTSLTGIFYEGYFLSTSGATLGKKIMDIKVLHAGEYPSFLRASCRNLAKGLSFMICMIGYIMAFFTEDNKSLHDMICDTIVVKG